MINKQNLWFLTLFSLIIVLSVYYFTLSDDTLATLSEEKSSSVASIDIKESDAITSMRVANDEEVMSQMEEYQNILLDEKASGQEKNDAYDSLQQLSANKTQEEEITKKIKEKFKLDSFTKIKDNQINVVISSDEHNNEIANNIIRTVQELFEVKKYITVKFEK